MTKFYSLFPQLYIQMHGMRIVFQLMLNALYIFRNFVSYSGTEPDYSLRIVEIFVH